MGKSCDNYEWMQVIWFTQKTTVIGWRCQEKVRDVLVRMMSVYMHQKDVTGQVG